MQSGELVRVAAVVLAAGASTRMGATNKLLLDAGGMPMIRRIVEAALASRARPVVVVTGHQAEQVEAALAGLAIALPHNADFEAGMSTSVRRGVEALPQDVDGVLFLLGDMPWVASRHIDALIDAFATTEAETETKAEAAEDGVRSRICAAAHGGRRGNPVLWGARYLPELRKLTGDRGARDLLARYADSVVLVETDDAVITDLDTPAAASALARFRTSDNGEPTSQ